MAQSNTQIDPSQVQWDAPDPSKVVWDGTQSVPPALTAPTLQQAHPATWYQNAGAGILRGAADIGSTLLYPLDAMGVTGMTHAQRQAAIDQFMSDRSDPTSAAYGAGRLDANILGTAGAGPALGGIAKFAGAAPKVAAALETGGFSLDGAPSTLANNALRAGAGATVGAASSGLVDPSSAKTGGAIGAVAPGVTQLAAMGGAYLPRMLGGAIGATTGVGGDAVAQAFKAGQTGDTSFLANLRGEVPMSDVIDQAKIGLSNMRAQRAAEYRAGMAGVSNDKTILDYSPIQKAASSLQQMGSYKGQVINKNAAGTVQDIVDQVNNWGNLDPAQFHTPEGLDALKQSIGDIRDATDFGTPGRKAADTVYNAVKSQISAQAPDYAKTMQGYADASDQLNNISKTLSLNEKAAPDTALRKLQSIMRNNVNTNYGSRNALVNDLEQQGGVNIMSPLAGQAMSAWKPRGVIGAGEQSAGLLAALTHPATIPTMLASAPFMSPRLMGEAAYLTGRATGTGGRAASGLLNAIPNAPPSGLLGSNPSAFLTPSASLLFSQLSK